MKKFNRAIALVLTLCMVLCFVPAQAFADTIQPMALTSSSVSLELWITNSTVRADGETSVTISRNDDGIQTEEGVDISTLAPASGIATATNLTVEYWQAMRLDSMHKQTTNAQVDRTSDGTAFTHIRYYNDTWAYKALSGSWYEFSRNDQIVAYYLQPTDITDQITTMTKDWGYATNAISGGAEDGQVALSVSVVDAGTLTPSEEDIYAESTTIFNYWEDRDVGLVSPLNNSNYEIYKITVTPGERAKRSDNKDLNQWYSNDSIDWEKVPNEMNTGEWFNETEIWNISEGTAPMVSGVADIIKWPDKDTAFLILIYVRAKNADLTVKYVDDHDNGKVFLERGMFADPGESFYNLQQQSAVPNTDGTFTLDDDATLTFYNYDTEKEVVQTFEKDLMNVQGIEAKYHSGAYEYKGAELADNGTTLLLHYGVDHDAVAAEYILDFGLPVQVHMADVFTNLLTEHHEYGALRVTTGIYGDAVISETKIDADGNTSGDTHYVLTYSPHDVIQGRELLAITATYSDGCVVTRNIAFHPASTVNYEEGFATFTTAAEGGTWLDTGSHGNKAQAQQLALDDSAHYGYEASYAGELTSVTMDVKGPTNGTQAVSTIAGDKAQLTFTGTGIDVYANCDPYSSFLLVVLYEADGTTIRDLYQVDTTAKAGTTDATGNQDAAQYNLPIVSITDLPHGTYHLAISHSKFSANTTSKVYLDGFRVYNTLMADEAVDVYAANELGAAFLDVRDSVLTGAFTAPSGEVSVPVWAQDVVDQIYAEEGTLETALVLTGNGTADMEDLLVNGPKNELFLQPGAAVTFKLQDGVTAQIGMKAVNAVASYTFNGEAYTLSTTADMFYHPNTTGNVTIVNTGDSLLSLTKVKYLGGISPVAQLNAQDVASAYSLMALSLDWEQTPETPDVPEVPEITYADATAQVSVVDYKGREVAKVALTANGVLGEGHTFTAEQVLAAVKAQLPKGYALVDETAVTALQAAYGASAELKVQAGLTATVKVNYVSMFGRKVVGQAEIVVVQTSDVGYATVTAKDIRAAAPAGRIAVYYRNLRVTFGTITTVTANVL